MKLFRANSPGGVGTRRLDRQLAWTRRALWAERLARAFWPFFVVLCLGVALALFGGFAAFGALGHRVLLAVFLLAAAAALIRGGMRFHPPDAATVQARLDSADPGRPLAVLADALALGRGSDDSEAVWRVHRYRAAIAALGLRARWPDLRLATHDRFALRYLAPVLLIAGLIGAGGDWGDRLMTILAPPPAEATGPAMPDAVATAEAWAVPPAYTGLDTVYLGHDDGAAPVRLPQGSEITVRVTDAGGTPTIKGGEAIGIGGFATLGGGLAEARGVLAGSGELVIAGPDGELARWQVEMIPDAPPTIALEDSPSATLTRALTFGFAAGDDYGVTAAWAEIAPEGHDPKAARGLPLPPVTFALPLPMTGDARQVADRAIKDLTAHPWAGAPVVMRLYAEDGAGQVTASKPVALTIPARHFTDPLAAALVEQRRELTLDYGQAARVLDVVQAVTRRPAGIFEDAGTYLAVRSAIRRLARGIGAGEVPEVAPGVIELFWLAALALENGDLSSALEKLRAAEKQLRKALENGTNEDIRRAMQDLRAALEQYLRKFAQQQTMEPRDPNAPPVDPDQMLTRRDLQEMLDRMQQQAESGLRAEAGEMLSRLQRMIENLRAAQGQGQPGQGMQALQEMIMRQRNLSDRTFDELRERRRGQPGQGQGTQPGERPGQGEGPGRTGQGGAKGEGGTEGQGNGLARAQEELRRQLDSLSRGMGREDGAARQALDEAARAMGEARDNLRSGQTAAAVRDQMEALDRLNDGARALARQQRQGQGTQSGRRGAPGGAQSDPFGRPTPSYGPQDGAGTKLPDRAEIDRALELMRLLRDRAADRTRPEMELDYLRRLLEKF